MDQQDKLEKDGCSFPEALYGKSFLNELTGTFEPL
jgi:hypothetical protein